MHSRILASYESTFSFISRRITVILLRKNVISHDVSSAQSPVNIRSPIHSFTLGLKQIFPTNHSHHRLLPPTHWNALTVVTDSRPERTSKV